MEPRPTPTSPRFAHRYPAPSPPNVPLLVAVAFTAALLTAVIGVVTLRLLPESATPQGTPAPTDTFHPMERVRELRSTSVTETLGTEDAARVPAVAIGSDGWVVTVVPAGAVPTGFRAADGSTATVTRSVRDPGSSALFLEAETPLTAVPLAAAEARYVGEVVAIVTPTEIAGDVTVAPGTIVATHALSTGSGIQSSDASPSVIRIQASTVPRAGTPVFTVSGDLLGLTIGTDASGSIAVLPSWVWSPVLRGVLADGVAVRPTLGLTGRPADVRAGGQPGFTLAGTESYPAVARGSAAEAAGLRAGDTIVRVDDAGVTLDHPLADLLQARKPGDTVTLTVRRAGVDRKVPLTLGRAPAP